MSGLMAVVHPRNWMGWTAILIVIVLAVIAGLFEGSHRLMRMVTWGVIAVVAAVAAFNSNKG